MDKIRFVIFSCGYNCKDYVEKHIVSIKSQSYQHFTHIMIDDASTDNTYNELIKHCQGYSCYVFRNDTNQKWIANAIQYLDVWAPISEDVVVIIDMDDWLIRPDALELVAKAYENDSTWMTYSRFMYTSNSRTSHWIPIYSSDVISKKLFRGYIWSWTHLRTFRKFLWDNIDKEDLKGQGGNYFENCYDQAIGLPMLEMSSRGHIKFVPEVLYAYNDVSPLQVEKINRKSQEDNARYIRSKKKYLSLQEK